MQRKKTVAYSHALQYCVEKTDPPTGGKPSLLAESVRELQEEMRCYLSFSDKEVFEGVTPLEEMSVEPAEKAETPSTAATPTGTPKVQSTTKLPGNQVQRGSPLGSLDGRRCCTHPSLWWLWGSSLICQEVQSRNLIVGR